MPILSTRYEDATADPTSRLAAPPRNHFLVRNGPRIQVLLGIAEPVAASLLKSGARLPDPIAGMALIDTGASTTCIDERTAELLRLPVTDVVMVSSASHAATQQNVYPARIDVLGLSITIDALSAVGAPLSTQGIIALIGRDVLSRCTLFYDGISGSVSLAI